MARFTLHAPGPWGEKGIREYSYSMVMEVDGRVELSGQGGWRPDTLDFPVGIPIETEVARAFDNVAFMLDSVGLNWSNVAHVNSYHVPEEDGQITRATAEVGRQFRQRGVRPVWTCLGVAALGDPKMHVEVRVTAFRD
ncbi:MAG: Rid family hydrolase [Rhizobiaceae bacterium]